MDKDTTHFGFTEVPFAEKTHRVGAVFDSVAERYDVMNDVMSFGLHRLWKRYVLQRSHVRRGQRVLDVAGGSGDVTALMAERVGPTGHVVLADINARMLERGRARLVDDGWVGNIDYVQADAERLPFAEAHFDCVSIAFGLRNVTRLEAALRAMYRVLKPGGEMLILEFSHPVSTALRFWYDLYSFKALPMLGKLVARDGASYTYLAESIRRHPDQVTLQARMEAAGFEHCDYTNINGGIVALHRGYKL